MEHPYRDKEEVKRGKCPKCNAPDVLLYPYEHADPYWDQMDPLPPEIVVGWKCRLCFDVPEDPRRAVCYIGNLILKALHDKT